MAYQYNYATGQYETSTATTDPVTAAAAAAYSAYASYPQYYAPYAVAPTVQPAAAAVPAATAASTTHRPPASAQHSSSRSSSSNPAPPGTSYTGYDAAVYAAASSYLASKTPSTTQPQSNSSSNTSSSAANLGTIGTWTSGKSNTGSAGFSSGFTSSSRGGAGSGGGRGSFGRFSSTGTGVRSRAASVQLHYCEVCKISCGGAQSYKAHLEGKQHKRKVEISTGATSVPAASNKHAYRCELCQVTCTGEDTYNAHLKGKSHAKTLRLHQSLGKPIPNKPTITPAGGAGQVTKVVGVQKVPFVGGKMLTTTESGQRKEVSIGPQKTPEILAATGATAKPAKKAAEYKPEPVGEDYVETTRDENGRVVYHCKLCDCNFNDNVAKDMHLKGRRHRMAYKKKVDPSIYVDMKSQVHGKSRAESERMRRDLMKMRAHELNAMRSRYEMEMDALMCARPPDRCALFPMGPPPLIGGFGGYNRRGAKPCRNYAREYDRYIMAKHTSIYPTEPELEAFQEIVCNVEKALKAVSDKLAAADDSNKDKLNADVNDKELPDDPKQPARRKVLNRQLKGVMRVGPLAKGLLLKGDRGVHAVLLCNEKPTRTLLDSIVKMLPAEFEALEVQDKYTVTPQVEQSAIAFVSTDEMGISLKVTLTSPVVREEEEEGGTAAQPAHSKEFLPRTKCLEALAALRHAKWFQARCANSQSVLVLLRVMRDLCKRVPTWTPLTLWSLELLAEKVMNSSGSTLSPGEGFRRIFESVASGLLLYNGNGLLDPCEKEPVDGVGNMNKQQREDITASAQHALRLIAFDQIYHVLDMEKLVEQQNERKRQREASAENGDGKKDKKEADENGESSAMEVEKKENKKESGKAEEKKVEAKEKAK